MWSWLAPLIGILCALFVVSVIVWNRARKRKENRPAGAVVWAARAATPAKIGTPS